MRKSRWPLWALTAAWVTTAFTAGDAEPVAPHSVARGWNEQLLDAIRIDRPKPPVHARNLFHLSVAMWDAWAAYAPDAQGYLYLDKHEADDVQAAREEAISFAAHRLLRHRFPGGGIDTDGQPCQPGAAVSLAAFDAALDALGYDRSFVATEGDTPAALGNRIGQLVIDYGLSDGASEGEDLCYPDDTGYRSVNPELVFGLPGIDVIDPNRWQPLAFEFLILQNEIVIGAALQTFVGVGWGNVANFGLDRVSAEPTDATDCGHATGADPPPLDPGCAPQFGGVGHDAVVGSVVELIAFNAWTNPDDSTRIDRSPGVYGNNSLGADDGTGHRVNPLARRPYGPNEVKRSDWVRVLAEFWADGPDSETPPGHWNVLANNVTDHLRSAGRRFGGRGETLDPLEWDVKLYLALNGAMHDAAVAAWGAKHYYDSSRPLTLVRYLGELGQSTDPARESYHPLGLPLVPGLIEEVTPESSAPGERHEHLGRQVGKIALRAWRGSPADPENGVGGVGWIHCGRWLPYQAPTFVTPPFPGYISGHSTFSRAGAEVLAAFSGSEFFPGGLGTFVAVAHEYLRFEDGPSEAVELQWATYFDAADEAGISRRYGGIHPYFDDLPARIMAATIGRHAFVRAFELFGRGAIDVCHKPPVRRTARETVRIDASNAAEHLAHGDLLRRCPPRR